MTADERVALIKAKSERAKYRVGELRVALEGFFTLNPYRIATKRDPDTRRLIYYLSSVQDVPTAISLMVGEVLQSLRSSLDHLAYQLYLVSGGTPPGSHIYFPIADNAAKYQKEAPQKTKGIKKAGVAAIDAVKPYAGGNDLLWQLHKLNNIDKHRLLVTVGSAFRSLNVAPILERAWKEGLVSNPELQANLWKPAIPDVFLQPSDRMCPLKNGDELFEDLPDSEPSGKVQFRFEIAINESPILKDAELMDTLQRMVDLTDSVIASFRPHLQ